MHVGSHCGSTKNLIHYDTLFCSRKWWLNDELYSPFNMSNITIRCQSNLLRKERCPLQQDKLVLSEEWWICWFLFSFYQLFNLDTFIPMIFNYITPLWSAANYYQQLSVRWKAWNIPKKCMHLTGTKCRSEHYWKAWEVFNHITHLW